MKVELLPIVRIEPDPQQPRKEFLEEALTGLAQSIREVGLLQPIRVRANRDGYVILDGERRWRAAKLAGLTHLEVIVEESELSEAATMQRQLIANAQREDLKPLEAARAVEALIKASGWTAAQTAKKLGFSNAKVTRLLGLLSLPAEVQAKVASGEISASAGYELSRVADVERQGELAAQVASGRLTRDAVAARVRGGARPVQEAANPPARITARLGGGRSVTLVGPELGSVETLINWLTELLTEARKARTQNFELATFVRTLRDRAKAERA